MMLSFLQVVKARKAKIHSQSLPIISLTKVIQIIKLFDLISTGGELMTNMSKFQQQIQILQM